MRHIPVFSADATGRPSPIVGVGIYVPVVHVTLNSNIDWISTFEYRTLAPACPSTRNAGAVMRPDAQLDRYVGAGTAAERRG